MLFEARTPLRVRSVPAASAAKNDARYSKIEMAFARIGPRPADGVTTTLCENVLRVGIKVRPYESVKPVR